MKGSGKMVCITLLVTALGLFYVHLQVSLFHLSYSITEKTEQITDKSERLRHLQFDVEQLRAPGHLEAQMQALALDLTLPKEIEVVRVLPPRPAWAASNVVPELVTRPFTDRLLDFFGRWIGTAQAKTEV